MASLPEGQEVTVVMPGTVEASPRMEGSRPHSMLVIVTVGLGPILRPLNFDDDLLAEMLEDRP